MVMGGHSRGRSFPVLPPGGPGLEGRPSRGRGGRSIPVAAVEPVAPAGAGAAALGLAALGFMLLVLMAGVAAAGEGTGAVGTGESAAAAIAEPPDYRMDAYRAPTPETLQGATVVDTAAAMALHGRGVPFIDVLPRAPRPVGLPEGTIWHPKPRADIPGSLWLVDTGYGALPAIMESYFFEGLARATKGDKAAPFVVYCQRDCWMSWNAARRAVLAGYTAVHWYPDGTDGWAEAGGTLVPAEPEPRPDEAPPGQSAARG